MKSIRPRKGFTLLELTLAMAFLTMIALGATATFIYILGVYNKSQSLIRTQSAARSSMDTLVKDLRLTGTVFPISTYPAGYKQGYCLVRNDGSLNVLYVLRKSSVNNRYQLIRSPANCRNITGSTWTITNVNQPYEQLVEGDLWSDDDTTDLSGTVTPGLDGYRPFIITPADSRCNPAIGAASCPTTAQVWAARISVFRGASVPGKIPGTSTADLKDQFAASTTLQTTVTTRD